MEKNWSFNQKDREVSEMKSSKKKIIYCFAVIVSLIVLFCLALYLKSVSDYKQAVNDIVFEKIDITKIQDGTYVGECNVNFIYAKVEVTVHNGKIKNIDILEHKNERGEAAETVVDRIADEQKIDVDAVSGATNSSTILKKAVENALAQ